MVKNLPASAADSGDSDSIPESGRSPGVGNGNPLQYSRLKISWTEEPGGLLSMGSQSRTWLSMHAHTCVKQLVGSCRIAQGDQLSAPW